MRLLSIGVMTAAISLLCPTPWADDFGMVMDVQGKPRIERSGGRTVADIGDVVAGGDRLLLAERERATIVGYADCLERELTGPLAVTVEGEGLKASPAEGMRKGRALPVCYRPEELNVTDSGGIGGLVLRSPKRDPVVQLRAEFKAGAASHATLITLVMHDLDSGAVERARPYFEQLRRDAPASPFVIRFTPRFDQPRGR